MSKKKSTFKQFSLFKLKSKYCNFDLFENNKFRINSELVFDNFKNSKLSKIVNCLKLLDEKSKYSISFNEFNDSLIEE